jgi:hypothetical protein
MGGEAVDLLEWWAERVDRDFDEATLDRLAAGEEAAIHEVVDELEAESVLRIQPEREGDGERVAYTIDLAECLTRSAGGEPAEADGGSRGAPADHSEDDRE